MVNLEKHDLYWCIRCLPKRVLNLMKESGSIVMLAGGYIRSRIAGEVPNDIFHLPTEESLQDKE